MNEDFKNKIALIIPAYKPQDRLLSLIEESKNSFDFIIVVNDGSPEKYNFIFEKLSQYENVKVLRHAVNLGKGAALKTAFNYYLTNIDNLFGVITMDADGQHDPSDVKKLANEFIKKSGALILGVREFKKNIPWKSYIGNKLTNIVFKFLIKKKLIDTQTGLRAIPKHLLKRLLKLDSNGYDFELEMLLLASQSHIDFIEVPIQTIYENNNIGSHFNPIFDSIKIYFVLLRYFFVSLFIAFLDILIFYVCYRLSGYIFISIFLGRALLSKFSFSAAKKIVFNSGRLSKFEIFKYLMLILTSMLISYFLINMLFIYFGFKIISAKIVSESLLFFTNFSVQRTLIFKKPIIKNE